MCKQAWSLSAVAWLGGLAIGLAAEPKEMGGRQVEIQVVIADLAAKDRTEALAAEPAEKLLALLRQLEEQGKLEACSRVRLTTLEFQTATAQFGERRAVASGRRSAPAGGFGGGQQSFASLEIVNFGTLVTATPQVAGDGSILVELQIEKSRLADAPANEAARPEGDAAAPARTLTSTTRNTVRIGDGQSVVLGGLVQSSPAKDQVATLIVVTARTIGPDVRRAAANSGQRLQMYALANIRARDVLGVLKAVFDDKLAHMGVDERTNSLIVSGSAEELSKIEAILQRLDAKSP